MSSPATLKRAHDNADVDAEVACPVAKATKVSSTHPTHPYYILDHLIKNVLPEGCQRETARAFYEAQLEDPEAALEECKSMLAGWVTEIWDKGTLWNYEALKKHAVTAFPRHGAVYLILIKIGDKIWRYVGQSKDCRKRISQHTSLTHRNNHPSFLYFLHTRAEDVLYLLPVSDVSLDSGPILNILEQWMSLVFLALQPSELNHNLSSETLKWVHKDEIHAGMNVREPLAQWLSFADFPIRATSFRYSSDSLKREWYEIRRLLYFIPRQDGFLRGDIFEGSFWDAPGWYHADYEFQIWSVKLRVGRSWIDRCEEETIRVWCDLRPEGEQHPSSVIRGLCAPPRYDDPARRLGIKISGIRKGDQQEGWCWVQMEGNPDKSIPRVNRLVDWLDGLDTEELRPRRYYPFNVRYGRRYCGYTRHPLDVGEAWSEILSDNGRPTE
ncbi:hypothetical protein GQ44DRAFT_605810 [Phaeosphaeriaceae sp. PMI808]|nr:hypothetical protein GQ44DRAFT_605810 [Phaeosphaeriaceae sp. PMI808]